MRVTFNELAERELNDAAEYYELERPGLGTVFIAEVQRCTEGIVAYPQAAPPVRGAIRRRLCQRFPYGLLYPVTGDEIRILAVIHLRRRPGCWVGRKQGGLTSGCSRRRLVHPEPPGLNRKRSATGFMSPGGV